MNKQISKKLNLTFYRKLSWGFFLFSYCTQQTVPFFSEIPLKVNYLFWWPEVILPYHHGLLLYHLPGGIWWPKSAFPQMYEAFTLDCTSALWSFWSRSAADLVSSFLAAMCRAGSLTFPLVSFSKRMATAWLCPCWSATARGVKPSW